MKTLDVTVIVWVSVTTAPTQLVAVMTTVTVPASVSEEAPSQLVTVRE